MSKKFYTINVFGADAAEVEAGTLSKETGLPTGPTDKFKMELGEINIPNNSNVWGIEETEGKTDKLTGKIEFLPYGDPRGGLVNIRYAKNSTSLSKRYQQTVQKIDKLPDDETEITLKVGRNEFDEDIDKMLIEMLRRHSMNGDNESRGPKMPVVFENYNGTDRVKKKSDAINTRRQAEDYVLDAEEKPDAYAVLASFFDLNPAQDDDILREALLEKIELNHVLFLEVVNEKKNIAKAILSEAYKERLLRGAKGEELTILEKGKERPFIKHETIVMETDELVDFVMANIMNPDYYDSVMLLDRILVASREATLS